MLLRETSDVTDEMVELAVVVMTMNEVGDDRADRRRGEAFIFFLHLEAEKTKRAVCAELQEVFR